MGGTEAKPMDPKEEAKQNKRMIERSQRKVERERKKLGLSEKKYLSEIKALAKQGKHSAAKILMKDLVRLRHQCDQYMMMESQLKSMAMQVSSIQTQSEITKALRGATSTMTKVNAKMDIKDIQQVMKQFTKVSESMGVKMEMMEAATEDISGDVTEEADQTYEQVLGEVGLEMVSGQAVPTSKLKGKEEKADVSDLEKKLQALKE